MMKKLLVCALIALSFAACEKKDTDQHCWKCYTDKTRTDEFGSPETTTDSVEQCGFTQQEIELYKNRYKKRTLLEYTYSDMWCEQQAPKP